MKCQQQKNEEEFYVRHLLCKMCFNQQRKRESQCGFCSQKFYAEKKGKGRFCSLKCRFFSKVQKTDTCWLWKGSLNRNQWGKRYGTLQMGEKNMLAHRISYELFKGKIPKGKIVCHQCDIESCVNPNHLWLGSYQDNMEDMRFKKRENYVKGSINPASKLTEKEVEKIKELYIEGWMIKDISSFFGVTRHCIQHILKGKTWKHLIQQ